MIASKFGFKNVVRIKRNIKVKVCILSMQRIGNVGSLLQSYALKTTIERLGHQVEFIDIEK